MPSDPEGLDPVAGPGVARLHPVSPVLDLLGFGRELIPGLVAVVATGWFWLLPVGFVALVGFRYLAWWRRTWSFDGTVFRFEDGVLERTSRQVPADRIQQVELVRKLRHQALGLAALRVETAGGAGGSEIDLDAVELDLARRLRGDLLSARDRVRGATTPAAAAADGSTDAVGAGSVLAPPLAPQPARTVLRLSPARLALAGVTGAQLLVFATALAWLGQVVDDLPGGLRPTDVEVTGPVAVAVAVVAAVVLWLGLAAAAAIVTWYGLTLTRVGDELHLARGLLERRDAVIPVRRVQVVRVSQSLLRRPLRSWSVRIQSAGQPGGSNQESSRAVLPLLTRPEVARVLAEVWADADLVALSPAPGAARRRAVLRRAGGVAVAAAPVVVLGPTSVAEVAGWAVLVAVGVLWGLDAYRGLGHAWAGDILVARTGSVVRETTLTPRAKAQSARVTASPSQRRAALATTRVDVAGRGPAPRVADETGLTAGRIATRLVRTEESASDEPRSRGCGGFPPAEARRGLRRRGA